MSILIKGVDMPMNGRVTIELSSEETGTNILARITDDKTGKLIEHKGAVVIPTPHGDLIDRDMVLCLGNVLFNDTVIHKWAVLNVRAVIEAEE